MTIDQAKLLTKREQHLINLMDSRDSLLEDESIQSDINIRYQEYILSGANNEEAAELSFMDNIDAFEIEYNEEEKRAYCRYIIIRNAFESLGPHFYFDD